MRRFIFTLVIAITTRACVVQANPARLGGFKWSLDTTTTITEDDEAFNGEFAKSDDEYGEYPEKPFYLDEDGGDARFSVVGKDDRYVMPPLTGEAEDFVNEMFYSVKVVGGGSSDRYKMPPVYSVQQLYDMKNGNGSNIEEGTIEEDDDDEGDD